MQPPLNNESLNTGDVQRWIIIQEGSRQTYGLPLSFHRLGRLRLMYTDIWCRWGRSLLKRVSAGTRALATRFHREIPAERVVSFTPHAALWRLRDHLRPRFPGRYKLSEEFNSFGRWLALRVRQHINELELDPAQDCFLGFNTNCLETLELLKARRIFTVVDQVDPGPVEENIVQEEVERWPGWEGIPGRMSQSYWDRLKAEWAAADSVLVNSNWSREALVQQGVPFKKIIVVPLAIDLAADHVLEPVSPEGPLKVLWLGSIVLRKGIQYLVEAARKLERHNVEFLLAGPLGISRQAVSSFPANMKLLGRVTRDQLGSYYRQAHVFVLPTLSDGFAITQLEAMAHGLPVITTPNCGNVVREGLDGFIVPIRDSGALADAIARLDSDRPLLRAMSANALMAVQKYDLPSNAKLINDLVSRRRLSFKEKDPSSPYAS
jgi:glycosyltransferase involved in cell wall biosynthesis